MTAEDPSGVTSTYTYDANGNLLSASRPVTGESPLASGTLLGQDTVAGRSTSSGWGTATGGNAWTVQAGDTSLLSTGSGEAAITGSGAAPFEELTLGSRAALNEEAIMRYTTGSFTDDVGRLLLRYSAIAVAISTAPASARPAVLRNSMSTRPKPEARAGCVERVSAPQMARSTGCAPECRTGETALPSASRRGRTAPTSPLAGNSSAGTTIRSVREKLVSMPGMAALTGPWTIFARRRSRLCAATAHCQRHPAGSGYRRGTHGRQRLGYGERWL